MKITLIALALSSLLLSGCTRGSSFATPIAENVWENIDLPPTRDLSNVSTYNCSALMGTDVFSANNPDKNGVYSSSVDPKREIRVQVKNKDVSVAGDIVTGYDASGKWAVIEDSDGQLIANIRQTPQESLRTNYLSLYIDKKTGQGFLTGVSSYTYVNRNIDSFNFYLSCID